jgi:prevent-host-death family protein
MKQVGLRELKNRLSEYVRAVRRGECVQATDRGQVVAEIIPRTTRAPGNLRDGLAALERRGLLEPPRARSGPVCTSAPDRASGDRAATHRRGAGRALILYAESSAVLAWLPGEAEARRAGTALAEAVVPD